MADGTVIFRPSARQVKRMFVAVRKELREEGVNLRDPKVRRVMRQLRTKLLRAEFELTLVVQKKE